MGAAEVTAFLNHLVAQRHVASATQNQELAALLFLYREALDHASGGGTARPPVARDVVAEYGVRA